jgi:hypothetical protein
MPTDLVALARLGARIRIAQLLTEIETLLRAFPDLGTAPARPATSRRGGRRAKNAHVKTPLARAGRRAAARADREAAGSAPKKGTLSAAGRARIVAAQKKRWAATRAGKIAKA